jgi:signal transduction histidine kinase
LGSKKEANGMRKVITKIIQLLYSVPIRVKIFGIALIPIFILGLSLNYWITTGLSDWLSYLVPNESVLMAMEVGSRSVFLVSILSAIVAILFAVVQLYWLTRPILELQKAANAVAKGDLDSRATIMSNDEIGKVAGSFNDMLDHLVDSQKSLKISNRQHSLINQIAQATSKNQEIHDALYEILQKVLESLELKMGWIHLYDPEQGKFHLATWSGVNDDEKPILLASDPLDLCDCQKELISGELSTVLDKRSCKRFINIDNQTRIEHYSIALVGTDQPLGVMSLRKLESKLVTPEDLDLIVTVSSQISEYISKSWLKLKLDEKEAARQKLMKALIKSQEVERTRLAQELHDGAGQMLTSLLIRMKILERDLEKEKQSAEVNRLCGSTSDVIELIRRISYQNWPIVLEEFGLKKALENLMEDMVTQSSLEGIVDVEIGQIELPKEIETTIYRISQESLTNIIRHAQANNILLKLWTGPSILSLFIRDDGVGFDVNEKFSQKSDRHLGLIAIKDRLELLGGKLEINSKPGEGTEISAVIPMLEEVLDV